MENTMSHTIVWTFRMSETEAPKETPAETPEEVPEQKLEVNAEQFRESSASRSE